jgi:hypothetical protein
MPMPVPMPIIMVVIVAMPGMPVPMSSAVGVSRSALGMRRCGHGENPGTARLAHYMSIG